jgi:SAM-dependent methyltransferase
MSVFREYAEYYDILYKDKDYSGEVDFVLDCLGPVPQGAQLLELGSGTGRHAEALAKRGFRVTGVDMSAEMVEQARRRFVGVPQAATTPTFAVGDLRSVRLEKKFDLVVSLFHVFSYQVSNEDLAAAFRTAECHLAPNGKFLFDFWYGPAVLSDPPQVRIRRIRGSDFSVTRLAEPALRQAQNYVDVNYELIFERDLGGPAVKIREVHAMRYLFLPEICENLSRVGLRLVSSGAWMQKKPPGLDSWYAWAVAERDDAS